MSRSLATATPPANVAGLYLVADDLTGALDSAAAFCGRFGPIPVLPAAAPSFAGAHVAVDLATRDRSADFAKLVTARIGPSLAGAAIPFKKIDSLLRGHWAVELAELLRADGPFRTCVFAPAFPGQGRTMLAGRQRVREADGSQTTLAVDPEAVLRRLGLTVRHVPSSSEPGLDAASGGGPSVVIFDASTDADLDAVVRRGSRCPAPVLWCGSAGLARALAQREPPRVAAPALPVLAIVGSHHPVACLQVERATNTMPARRVIAGPDARETATRIAVALERTGTCLLTFGLDPGISNADAAASIGERLRDLMPGVERPSALLVAGGETLASLCDALGVDHLEVDAQIAPGVAHSHLRGGPWDGLAVVSKSGAFGHADLVSELLGSGP